MNALNESKKTCEGAIGLKEKAKDKYRELAKELEEIRKSIDLLIRRIKWIEEEVFPEMESKIAWLVDKKIEEIEREWRTYLNDLVRFIKVRGEEIS